MKLMGQAVCTAGNKHQATLFRAGSLWPKQSSRPGISCLYPSVANHPDL